MSIATTVWSHLRNLDVPYEVVRHPRASTAQHAARLAHVSGKRLAKAVLFDDDDDFVMVVLPACRRVDVAVLRALLGRDLHMSAESELVYVFRDCDVGALPPLGAAYGLFTVVDEETFAPPDVYFEAGDHERLVHVTARQFRSLQREAEIARISAHAPR